MAEVSGLLEALDQASAWLPLRIACLERSLAAMLWCGLRRRSVRWCLGVRTPPFAAHAWIEINGQPVGELVPVRSYCPILTIDTPFRSAGDPRRRPRQRCRAAVDYRSYVHQPDGSILTQSTACNTIQAMCHLLELTPGLRVLEIGTGSGYTGPLPTCYPVAGLSKPRTGP
jgi:hypothetical protein